MADIEQIRQRLTAHEPLRVDVPVEPWQRASVALVLAGPPHDLSLCFIERAAREGDHWSGQMAFPGGRSDPSDPDLLTTSIRETAEEVGVDLTAAELLGPLDAIHMRRRLKAVSGIVQPYVFHAGPGAPALRPEASEVARAWWIPLGHLWAPANRASLIYREPPVRVAFPAIRWKDQLIWGLSYRVLRSFADLLGRPLVSEE